MLFFPEVILGGILEPDDGDTQKVTQLYQAVNGSESFRGTFNQFKLQFTVTPYKTNGSEHEFFRRTILTISDSNINNMNFRKFNIIDGNHRLAVTSEDSKFKEYNIPFLFDSFQKRK